MRRVRRKSVIDYILPFLILLGLGVIGVLGYQLWSSFEKQGKADVYFHLVEGKAKFLPYGQTTWDTAFSGTKLLLGDSLKTSALGKLVLVFFNGTVIRMGNDSAVTLTDVSKQSDQEQIVLNLDNGSIWVNGKKSPGVKEAHYHVRTVHMLVKAKGTVFEVESGNTEVVRVFDGEVSVDIMINSDGKERVADSITVGVGQQIVLDEATLKAFEDNQNPSILQMISEEFKTTDWYLWNLREDNNPTDFGVAGRVIAEETQASTQVGSETQEQSGSQETMQIQETEESQETQQTQETEEENDVSVPEKPVISNPVGGSKTTEQGRVTISGTVAKGTAKVVVEQFINGRLESYTLSKFQQGDTAWAYNVVESFGNLIDGKNTYKVYAVNSKGTRSDPAEIIITYNKPEITQTQETSQTSSQETTQQTTQQTTPTPTSPGGDIPPPSF